MGPCTDVGYWDTLCRLQSRLQHMGNLMPELTLPLQESSKGIKICPLEQPPETFDANELISTLYKQYIEY